VILGACALRTLPRVATVGANPHPYMVMVIVMVTLATSHEHEIPGGLAGASTDAVSGPLFGIQGSHYREWGGNV
jgi:hypothetical protein